MNAPDRQTQLLQRIEQLMRLLAVAPRSFTVLQQALGDLPAPTLSRMLKSAQHCGWVEAGPDGYRLAAGARQLGATLCGKVDVAGIIAPWLADLRSETGASAACYEWDDGRVVLRAVAEAPESFHYQPIGGDVPELTRHGFARLLVAHLPEEQRRRVRTRTLRPMDWDAATWEHLSHELRRDRLVIENGNHTRGVVRIAGIVCREGAPWLALGVTAIGCDRDERRRIAAVVDHAARLIQQRLDAHGALT